jgi:hypothetical protein
MVVGEHGLDNFLVPVRPRASFATCLQSSLACRKSLPETDKNALSLLDGRAASTRNSWRYLLWSAASCDIAKLSLPANLALRKKRYCYLQFRGMAVRR